MLDSHVQFFASDNLVFTEEHQNLVSSLFGVRVCLSNDGSCMTIHGYELTFEELPDLVCDIIDPNWRSWMFTTANISPCIGDILWMV